MVQEGRSARASGTTPHDLDLLVRAEQVRTLYAQRPTVLLTNPLNAVIVAALLWSAVSHAALLVWCMAMAALTAVRIGLRQRYWRRPPVPAEAAPWGTLFTLGAGASGALWGAAGLFAFAPGHLTAQVILTFVIGGMSAGSSAVAACHLPAVVAFMLPSVVPLAARLFAEGDALHNAMGATVVVFVIGMLAVARTSNASLREAFRLRFENTALLDGLSRAQSSLELANADLERRVAARTAELEHRARREEALADLGQHMMREEEPGLDAVLDAATRSTCAALDADFAAVFEVFGAGHSLLLRAGTGWNPHVGLTLVDTETDPVAARALRGGAPVVIGSFTAAGAPARSPLLAEHGVQSALAALVQCGGTSFGLLAVYARRPGAFGAAEVEHVRVVASLLANAVERQRALEALRASETKFAELVRESPDGIALLGPSGVIESCNPTMERLTGLPSAEILGRRFSDVAAATPEAIVVYEKEFAAILAGEARAPVEVEIAHAGAARLPVEINSRLVARHDGTRRVQITVRDVSERSRAARARAQIEAQLRQAQRLEAIGRLAGGVAHDFNNLLTVVQSNASLLETATELEPGSRELAVEITEAARRAAALTRQLLAFGQRQAVDPRELDLNDVILDIQRMLERVAGRAVKVIVSLDPQAARIKADPSQIEQILINLAANARDAMPHGGSLTIETSTEEVGPLEAARRARLGPGSYVVITVTDTGAGMSASTQQRLFEPFFTTKEVGQGSGLGLAAVYGIVEQGGGDIEVSSAPGTGTAFRVHWPRLATPGAGALRPGTPVARARILLVEDEPLVRRAAERILGDAGFQVMSAEDGAQALALVRDDRGRIDLLLGDLVMPGLGGPDLADRLTALRPGLRVLYLSAHPGDAVRDADGRGAAPVLRKPFSAQSLVAKVEEVLRAGSAAGAAGDTGTVTPGGAASS